MYWHKRNHWSGTGRVGVNILVCQKYDINLTKIELLCNFHQYSRPPVLGSAIIDSV